MVFARKLVRPFGDIDSSGIQNEFRAVTKLCAPGGHKKKIVPVLRCGKLPGTSFFFVDMERCDLNLENYLKQKWTSNTWERTLNVVILGPSEEVTAIRNIMKDITKGVAFIHSQEEVHRDLKPRNGNTLC